MPDDRRVLGTLFPEISTWQRISIVGISQFIGVIVKGGSDLRFISVYPNKSAPLGRQLFPCLGDSTGLFRVSGISAFIQPHECRARCLQVRERGRPHG